MNEVVKILLAGFSIGILGSIHCVGMCGPLALALPIHTLSGIKKTMAILSYNFGRAFSYAYIGVIFGLAGAMFSLFELQQILTISAGILLLIIVISLQLGKMHFNFFSKASLYIHKHLGLLLNQTKSPFHYLFIGIVNGFLPCGLVYVAIVAGIATGSALNSGILLFGFGLGTLPIMALTMMFGKFISVSLRSKLNIITPYMMIGVAVLLILRGLNLGIPYISPKLSGGEVECCSHSNSK